MDTRTLRRRLVSGNDYRFHTSEIDALREPLLSDRDHAHVRVQAEVLVERSWHAYSLHWAFIFSQLIVQWANSLASIIVSSSSFIGRLIPITIANDDTSEQIFLHTFDSALQEDRYRNLQLRLKVPFDGSRPQHQEALRKLWRLAYPEKELPSLKSELWKEMGWQGPDPSTDFRGGGFIALENLLYFAENHPEGFKKLLCKMNGNRADWEYPFAVAGINISFMLVQMLDLHKEKPESAVGMQFLKMLMNDEVAFDELFCIAFALMDAHWLARHASYMDFNSVLQDTKEQLQRELTLKGIHMVKDLPSYNLLVS